MCAGALRDALPTCSDHSLADAMASGRSSKGGVIQDFTLATCNAFAPGFIDGLNAIKRPRGGAEGLHHRRSCG